MSLPRLPVVAVLDGREPPRLRDALAGVARLLPTQVPPDDSALLLLCGDEEGFRKRLDTLRETREHRFTPLLAWSEDPVELGLRLDTIRAGADDLVPVSELAPAVKRRVRLQTTLTEGAPPRGPTPPRNVEVPHGEAGTLFRWLQGLAPYVERRGRLWSELGPSAERLWFEACHLRDKVRTTTFGLEPPAAYSLGRSGFREALDWPVRLVAPIEAEARIVNVGTDGCCLAAVDPLDPDLPVQISVRVQQRAVAELHAALRWQKRLGRDRWLCGALVTSATLHVLNN